MKEDICQAFQEIFDTGHVPSEWGRGLIHLVPKGEQASDDIRKWRPITILNTIYKKRSASEYNHGYLNLSMLHKLALSRSVPFWIIFLRYGKLWH